MSFPAQSEIARRSQVPLRNAVPADAPGRSHARRDGRRGIGEMPRKGRPYFGRPLAVESLSELCSVLENAADGRRDLAIALGTDSTR